MKVKCIPGAGSFRIKKKNPDSKFFLKSLLQFRNFNKTPNNWNEDFIET